MSTGLLIIAMLSFTCGWALLLAGFIGMMDLEKPKRRFNFIYILDLLYTDGFFASLCKARETWKDLRKNWSARSYERHVIFAGFVCLGAAVAIGWIAFAFGL